VKVLFRSFRRQVYSNSSTGLGKSAQVVPNTPPPIFGALLSLLMALGKEVFTFKKILS
jgi:hypothetical protein